MSATITPGLAPGGPPPDGSEEVAAATLAAIAPAMRAAVGTLTDHLRLVVGYHLGWWEADGTPRRHGAGKAVRPGLVLLSARLAGAPAGAGVDGAVAVELVHAFSLLHDDVMDRDATRRHRPTVWALWGEPTAILAGDALQALAVQVLLRSASPRGGAAAAMLLEAVAELVRGQCEDMAFEDRESVAVAECEEMVAGKTGALMGASAALGALMAGAPAATVEALHASGRHLGLAFQLVDDLLGIWGDPAVTGKPVLADLRERKKSVPVAHALEQEHLGASAELARFYAGEGAGTEEELVRAAALVEACGSRAWVQERARWHVRRAERETAGLGLPAGPAGELRALGRSLLGRVS